MIICPQCGAKIKFGTDKIIAGTARFKCPGCASVLRLKKSDHITGVPPTRSTGCRKLQQGVHLDAPGEETLIGSDKQETAVEMPAEAEAGIPQQTDEAILPADQYIPTEGDGPFIPEDKLVISEKSHAGSLLEDFAHERLTPYDEGDGEAESMEWIHYAAPQKPQIPASKIDMNELPPAAAGLEETLTDLQKAETFNLQGENHTRKNQYKQAVENFSQALEICPDYVDALINRADSFACLGRFNDALMDFNHALKLNKRTVEIYNKRGAIYLQHNIYDQAIKDFTAALVLSPMYSDAYLNRGQAYTEKEMPEEARNDFIQAIRTDYHPISYEFVDRNVGWIYSYEKSGDNEEEAAEFNRQGLKNLQTGKYKEAVASFTGAINSAPGDAATYINRGQAYMKLGQPDKALTDFNQGIRFDPLNSFFYYLRAHAWKEKDDPSNMSADLKISCELGYEPACLEYRKFKAQKQ